MQRRPDRHGSRAADPGDPGDHAEPSGCRGPPDQGGQPRWRHRQHHGRRPSCPRGPRLPRRRTRIDNDPRRRPSRPRMRSSDGPCEWRSALVCILAAVLRRADVHRSPVVRRGIGRSGRCLSRHPRGVRWASALARRLRVRHPGIRRRRPAPLSGAPRRHHRERSGRGDSRSSNRSAPTCGPRRGPPPRESNGAAGAGRPNVERDSCSCCSRSRSGSAPMRSSVSASAGACPPASSSMGR